MNRLASSTSAYLRQHASNPVDWWTWGDDAFEYARKLDRPVFLSVGYAACHWCHVMAHESFEDPLIAGLLNDHFVAIKVDREERPDIDAIYMAATQLVTGQGGWPMSVFLLPDGRPFLAGTYYPPSDRHGMVGFPRLLQAVRDAWVNQRTLVNSQADELDGAMRREVTFVDHLTQSGDALDLAQVRQRLGNELVSRLDEHGGFGRAPKFPRASYVDALLHRIDDRSRHAVTLTLDSMCRGGIYDHFGGGFARYSVDDFWRVPHFEKMLSDQALLARMYLRASNQYSNDQWRAVAIDTLDFVRRELAVPDGYASSLDADADGLEGSHVTWTVAEVAIVLNGADYGQFIEPSLRRWRITTNGDIDGRSVPALTTDEPFVTPPQLAPAHHALRTARARRPQPSRDDKVILEWNAMLAGAFIASRATEHVTEGLRLLRSLRTSHFSNEEWWRVERRGARATAADLAWLIDAELDAFERTGEDDWLRVARTDAAYLMAHYWDGPTPTVDSPNVGGGFFDSSDLVTDTFLRTKGLFDSATPSSQAVGARALARLGLIDDRTDVLAVAQRLITMASDVLVQNPASVPDLVDAAGYAMDAMEIVIPGAANPLSDHVRLGNMRYAVLVTGTGSSPLLVGRSPGWAYVCRRGACQRPVATVADLEDQLRTFH